MINVKPFYQTSKDYQTLWELLNKDVSVICLEYSKCNYTSFLIKEDEKIINLSNQFRRVVCFLEDSKCKTRFILYCLKVGLEYIMPTKEGI